MAQCQWALKDILIPEQIIVQIGRYVTQEMVHYTQEQEQEVQPLILMVLMYLERGSPITQMLKIL